MDALFYPISYAQSQIVQLVYGMLAGLDVVDFPDEAGGDVDQALAVPFLAGMDAIVVTSARLVLRSAPKNLDIDNYVVSDNGSNGVFLSLPDPARLKKIEIGFDAPVQPPTVRIVVRGASKNGALSAGTPLFATPDFGNLGPMFNAVLGGMAVTNLDAKRNLLTLPATLGNAWLIQLATGDEVKDLAPLPIKPAINRVVLEAVPRNLSVVLAPDTDALTLWKNPGVLLPEAGDQEISFAPLAQKHLTAALQQQNATAATAALPVPLRFHSDCGGAVSIVTKSLIAEYQVQPFGADAKTFSLRGDFVAFTLSAPARLAPSKSALKLTVKLLGRDLNAASPEPTLEPPSSGLRVGLEHWIAAAINVAPRANEANGSVVQIASVRIYMANTDAAEIVLELRSDIANSPGAIVAAPLVQQLTANFSGWLEFELPTPLKVVAGNAPIWLALRTNKGDVRWFNSAAATDASALNSNLVSTDRGATWGAPNPQLQAPRPLLAQLFHVVDEPLAAPIIRIQRGATVLQNNIFANAQQKSAREYALDATALPAAVHTALANQSGNGRVASDFLLFSRSAIDVVVEALTLSYDPFTAANAATTSNGG
ncbi:MAG: hypothetical protein JWM78_2113 [Verrucomicrobiaceae bacterium]|nr:hypothetical protein [Verrucomicrobiaceae bacterium]